MHFSINTNQLYFRAFNDIVLKTHSENPITGTAINLAPFFIIMNKKIYKHKNVLPALKIYLSFRISIASLFSETIASRKTLSYHLRTSKLFAVCSIFSFP